MNASKIKLAFLHPGLLWKLGISNVFRIISYLLRLKLGLFKKNFPLNYERDTRFFSEPVSFSLSHIPNQNWGEKARIFDDIPLDFWANDFSWFYCPYSRKEAGNKAEYWWKTREFEEGVADIKPLWEISRMGWVLSLAQRARASKSESEIIINQLNAKLLQWVTANPPYIGINWKCGQEASVRVIHLVASALVLGQLETLNKNFCSLLEAHLERIMETTSYAKAQDNNHIVSEATALFIGGNLLLKKFSLKRYQKISSLGRKLIEYSVQRLIDQDGTFCQYSTNYHRFVVDQLNLLEIIRRKLSLEKFSDKFYKRTKSAILWLANLIEPTRGYVPNMGANDGSQILNYGDYSYLDFRPTAELGLILFHKFSLFTRSVSAAFSRPSPTRINSILESFSPKR